MPEIDPNFHHYLEQLALGDQKRISPKDVLNYLKRHAEIISYEDCSNLEMIFKKYEKDFSGSQKEIFQLHIETAKGKKAKVKRIGNST